MAGSKTDKESQVHLHRASPTLATQAMETELPFPTRSELVIGIWFGHGY